MTAQRFREIRLVTPVIACWCVLFALLIYGVATTGPGHRQHLSRAYMLTVTSGFGMWMAIVWLALYRKATFAHMAVRVAIWPFLTTGCAVLGTFAYYQLGRSNRLFWEPVILVAVLSAIAAAPMALLLVRSGWRIVDEDDATELAPPRLTLKRLLAIVTIVAVVVAFGMLLDFPHRDVILSFAAVTLAAVMWGVLILNSMSSFPISLVWPVAFLLAFIAASGTTLGLSYVVPQRQQQTLFKGMFVPMFLSFSYATFLLLLASSYLRWRGILFRFGGTSGFATRRDATRGFVKTCVHAASGPLLVLLILSVCVGVWRFRASRQAQATLSAIAQAGLPTTPEEARQYYDSLQSGPDITAEWQETLSVLDEQQFHEDFRKRFDTDRLFSTYPEYPDKKEYPSERPKELDAFVSTYSALLDRLHLIAETPGHVSLKAGFENAERWPHFFKLRAAVRLLACDAVVKAHHGDVNGFLASVETILRIVHLMDNEVSFSAQLARLSMCREAENAIHYSISGLDLPLASSSRLGDKLRQLDHFAAFRRGMIGERAIMTACFTDLERWPYASDVSSWRRRLVQLGAPSDLCYYLDYMQTLIDVCGQSPAEVWQTVSSLFAGLNRIRNAVPLPLIAATISPPPDSANYLRQATFVADACRVSLAIEGYRKEHQQIPVSLNDLVPEYLDRIPPDPYDGKPLRFEQWDGGYRVYSVARRGKDRYGQVVEYYEGTRSQFGFEVPRPTKQVDTGQGIEPPDGYSGPWQVFWPNGKLKHTALYINGIPDGKWATYFEDGKPEVTRQYKEGEIHGYESQRFSDGTRAETLYDRGQRVN